MKCLVTGATGFLGQPLCHALHERGHEVAPFSRSGASVSIGDQRLPTQALDFALAQPAIDDLQGVDVLIHCAGIAHEHADSEAYREVNHLATVELARRAEQAGVKSFVFLSSVRAMGAPLSDSVREENDSGTTFSPYGASKRDAERDLRALLVDSPMALVCLRPVLIYGRGAKGNLALLASAVHRGLPRPPDLGRRSMVALDDVVSLLCFLVEKPLSGVHTWIVCGEESVSTRQLYDALREVRGLPVGTAWMPLLGWRLAAAVLDFRAPAGGNPTFEKLFGTELYSGEALRAATGWEPVHRLADFLDTVYASAETTE